MFKFTYILQIILAIQNMGGCAGCMGPNRRSQNYKVNRLTENSPIKSRVTPSQLPLSRNKDRIIEELNQSKNQINQRNLISSLINSPNANFNPENNYSPPINSSKLNRVSHEQILIKDSYFQDPREKHSSVILLRKPSTNYIDENLQSKYIGQSKPMFQSEFRTSNNTYDEMAYSSTNKIALNEIRLNRNSQYSKLPLKNLKNIPELSEEESKTPNYVKQKRIQNGQDIKLTGLQFTPITLKTLPKLDLSKYLKDLQ